MKALIGMQGIGVCVKVKERRAGIWGICVGSMRVTIWCAVVVSGKVDCERVDKLRF